ncbi:MAG: hypothetical protein KKF46_07255 [Nanoarchaeota archaeon]|nr:hypothetical protein [Nanoarchaeota archaeon]MBU1322125.1 hypothetical protein [Nanoarchaeota archaeon]MBU2442281.1 hypothetical protein [Nanoarchaeota archaeon]
MIGNELEQEIISLYSKDISSLYSINQIAHRLGKKYPYINKKVSFLIKQKIFKKTIIGRSYLCSLNLNNDETIYLLILNEIRKKKAELELNPQLQEVIDYTDKARKIINLQLVIKSKDTIMFVLPTADDKEQFEKAIVKQVMKDFKTSILSKEEFLKQLLDQKELQERHVILHGYEKYYECIREIEDELKLRYSKLIP